MRTAFKTVVLGIQYGLGALTLSCRLGISVYEAAEMLARLRARYRVFEEFAACVGDYAGLNLEVSTCFGWTMKCSSGMRARTIRNFPIQATAAEILHVACVLAERRGIEIIAPVHDALMAECDLRDVEDVAAALDHACGTLRPLCCRVTRCAPTRQIIRPGGYYFDDRGDKMYKAVISRIAKIESKNVSA